jgi:hypothetical protein
MPEDDESGLSAGSSVEPGVGPSPSLEDLSDDERRVAETRESVTWLWSNHEYVEGVQPPVRVEVGGVVSTETSSISTDHIIGEDEVREEFGVMVKARGDYFPYEEEVKPRTLKFTLGGVEEKYIVEWERGEHATIGFFGSAGSHYGTRVRHKVEVIEVEQYD